MAAAFIFLAEEEGAKPNVYPYVRIDNKCVAIPRIVGDIICHIAAVQHIEVHFKILVIG